MNILFVCKGNIFRSMSAEYLMKQYLKSIGMENIFKISSAGTEAHIASPDPTIVEHLKLYNCDISKHTQRKVSKEILEQQDLIICMGENHKKVIEELGFKCLLFNEITYNKSNDVADVEEYFEPGYTPEQRAEYTIKVIDYIHEAIPHIVEKIIKRV